MSANIKIVYLDDLARHDAHLQITCLGCGRSAVYARQGIISWFRYRGLNAAWEVAGSYFRCTECGHKGASLAMAPLTPPKPPRPPVVEPAYMVRDRERRRRG